MRSEEQGREVHDPSPITQEFCLVSPWFSRALADNSFKQREKTTAVKIVASAWIPFRQMVIDAEAMASRWNADRLELDVVRKLWEETVGCVVM